MKIGNLKTLLRSYLSFFNLLNEFRVLFAVNCATATLTLENLIMGIINNCKLFFHEMFFSQEDNMWEKVIVP